MEMIFFLLSTDEVKEVVDRCTLDMLIRPDWDANIQCVDLVNAVTSATV